MSENGPIAECLLLAAAAKNTVIRSAVARIKSAFRTQCASMPHSPSFMIKKR